MALLHVHIDDRAHASLLAVSQQTGRTVEDLAEAAIEEAALAAERTEEDRQRRLGLQP